MQPNTFKVYESGIEFCHYGNVTWKSGKPELAKVVRFSVFPKWMTDDEKAKRIKGFEKRGYKRVFNEASPCKI